MFLRDKPESNDIRFGHTVVAEWLADEISKFEPPYRVALTGGLGTGKSTILKNALKEAWKKQVCLCRCMETGQGVCKAKCNN